MNIPEVCVKWFMSRFVFEPSVIEVHGPYEEKLYKKINESPELWFVKKVNTDGETFHTEKLVEYDQTGIFVYINPDGRIFILTKPDKKSISEFTVNNLKKNKK